ncbi:MAG TPA: hypothetical protein VF331_26430, partial [Polyangiales bacterium]
MTARTELIRRTAVRFALLVCVGLLPWPGLQALSSSTFRGVADAALQHISFGGQTGLGTGGVRLLPARDDRSGAPDDGPAWDTRLQLRVSSVPQAQIVYVSPRYSYLLPTILLLALVVAAPVTSRRKLLCAVLGIAALTLHAVLVLYLTSVWIFARVPGLVYTLTPAQQTLVELAYRGFVVPSSHRVVVPLVLASLLLFWQRERPPQRRTHVASSSLPLHV